MKQADNAAKVPNMTTGPLEPETRARVLDLAVRVGDVEAARLLGVARSTVTRAAVGLNVRPSVAIAIRFRLSELS